MAELAPGSVVAGCRIEAVIGRGGMGLVYRATQLSLERPVALKAIAPELAGDATFRERFKRESRIAASIEHPNVIPVYDSGEAEGVLYLLMRYVDGTDLRALIAREGGGLDPARAARLVAQVASGLAAAHRRGLVHRDVKPANVLVAADDGRDHAYVTDFGIARHVAATSGLTRTGAVVGTLDYLAPERMQGEGPDAAGADVYALGCVLYETLTGSVPYPRDNEVAKMYAHLNAPVPVVRELAPDVPRDFDEIVRCAMAKQPSDRFASAADLADALTDAAPPPRATTPLPPSRSPVAEEPPAPADLPDDLTEEALLEAETGPELSRAERTEAATAPSVRPAEPTTVAVPPTAEEAPAQEVPTVQRSTVAPAPAAAPAARRRGVLVVVGMALVAALAAAAVLVLAGDDGGDEGEATLAQAGRPIALGGEPDGVAVGAGSVWVADRSGSRVWHVDPRSRKATPHAVGENPDSVAFGARSVWVTNTGSDTVSRLDLNGELLGRISVGSKPEGILFAYGAAWVANSGDGTVSRIDPQANRATAIDVGRESSTPIQLAAGVRKVWVTLNEGGGIVGIDPDGDQGLQRIPLPHRRPRGIAFDPNERRLWVSSSEHNVLVVVDPEGRGAERGTVQVQEDPREVRYGMGAIWVTSAGQHFVTAVDPSTREKLGEAKVRGTPYGLDVDSSTAWVASLEPGRLTPFRLR